MKVLTAAVMFAFGARGIPGADAITVRIDIFEEDNMKLKAFG